MGPVLYILRRAVGPVLYILRLALLAAAFYLPLMRSVTPLKEIGKASLLRGGYTLQQFGACSLLNLIDSTLETQFVAGVQAAMDEPFERFLRDTFGDASGGFMDTAAIGHILSFGPKANAVQQAFALMFLGGLLSALPPVVDAGFANVGLLCLVCGVTLMHHSAWGVAADSGAAALLAAIACMGGTIYATEEEESTTRRRRKQASKAKQTSGKLVGLAITCMVLRVIMYAYDELAPQSNGGLKFCLLLIVIDHLRLLPIWADLGLSMWMFYHNFRDYERLSSLAYRFSNTGADERDAMLVILIINIWSVKTNFERWRRNRYRFP